MEPTAPEILQLETVDSTNLYVRDHFDELADGQLVTARFQTAGRGRLGRRWLAEPGVNFTGTFALKNIRNGFHAGCIVGLTALDAVREAAPGIDVYLKWPNDLYIGCAKLAGMLGEGVLRKGKLAGVAAGIGINVNASREMLDGVGQQAISMKIAAGKEFNPDFLAKSLAKFLMLRYIIYLKSYDEIFSAWRRENRLIGRKIRLVSADSRTLEGIFRDVTPEGEMLLDTGERVEKFNCGDVSIDKNSIGKE